MPIESGKNHTHSPKIKLNPKAEEALMINLALRSKVEQVERKFEKVYEPSRKVKVRVGKDIETKVCKRKCDKCPLKFRCYTERDPEFDESDWKQADVTKGTGKTLTEWKGSILREMPFVDIKPYSHNIISITLGAIAKGWGHDKANAIIDEFGLPMLGWHKEEENGINNNKW